MQGEQVTRRGSGILLHITSLPSPYGIGDLGPDAYKFVDFLSETGQSFWQILPLTLTSPVYGNSPYNSFSALAGNILLISPDRMVKNDLVLSSDTRDAPPFLARTVGYEPVIEYKSRLFRKAFERNRGKLANNQDFNAFCEENSYWLDDYALFVSIRNLRKGEEWSSWPVELRDRNESALREMSKVLDENILLEKFLQYIFFNQWNSLKNYCDSKSIRIMGDIPIYVNYDSADVWANPEIFSLDEMKKPVFVAGVPPDYFSSTGQLWGHPVYNWTVLQNSDFSWWKMRIGHNLKLYHLFRLDHFRGFVGFWQVRSGEQTAINGKWVEAPGEAFFNAIMTAFPDSCIVAEDLGVITPDVRDIIGKFGFPGMKVLLFAFGEDLPSNPYAPHNHVKNCVVYTGTHDNNTIAGWYATELTDRERDIIARYIGHEVNQHTVHRELIRLAMMSVADMVIIPMQDLLGLGQEHRMNIPGSTTGNWQWRLMQEELTPALKTALQDLTTIYGRAPAR